MEGDATREMLILPFSRYNTENMTPHLLDLHAHFPMHTKFPPAFATEPPPLDKELEYWAANQLLNYQKGAPRVSLKNLLLGADGGIGSVLYDPEDEFFHDSAPVPAAIGDLLAQMRNVEDEISGQVYVVRNPSDLEVRLHARQKFLFHCVEGAFCLSGNENNVDVLAAKGVAYVIVAHLFYRGVATCDNAFPFLPEPVFDALNPQQNPAIGLTDLGLRVVDRLLDRGIVVDITHSSEIAQTQIFELARDHGNKPVISSHNGVRATSQYPLNLSAETIQAIAASNGVVGIILFPHWLRNPDQQLTGPNDISLVFQAIDYIKDLTGSYRNIAIGTDLDGFIEPIFDCQNWAQTPNLVRLIQTKYPADYERILCWNAVETLQVGWKGV
jgi:microsomal dipeptidase-like Zn-dependent dipeptidase